MPLWIAWFDAVRALRPAAKRFHTFLWMILVLVGLSCRPERAGVASLVRLLGFGNRGQQLPGSKAVAVTTTARKPMSEEAKKRIGEGLRKYREAKALAKATQGAAPAPLASAPEPADTLVVSASEAPVEVPADAQVVDSEPQEPAQTPADVLVPDSPRGSRGTRKGAPRASQARDDLRLFVWMESAPLCRTTNPPFAKVIPDPRCAVSSSDRLRL